MKPVMKIEVVSPFPTAALPRVWGWIASFRHRVTDDFSPQTLPEFVEAMLHESGERKSWAVYGDGELGGIITFQRLSPWLGTAHAVFKPEFHRKNIALSACRMAVGEMFGLGIGKLSFYPLAGNLAIGSLLIQLGAKREGCLRAQTLCGGVPTAVNIYGLLKGEFEDAYRDTSDHREHSRSGEFDRGGSPGRPAEDQHPDVHSDAPSGTEGAAGPADGVLGRADVGPGSGSRADQDGGSR
jgi:RimJ/RimL family protein N-acetyltransferase